MQYIKTMENRKELVKRIEQLTGLKAVYTRMPECAFVIGDFKVEKKGTLVTTPDADPEVIETLLAEGMITEYEEETVISPEDPTPVINDHPVEAEMAETTESAEEPTEEPTAITISLPMENHTALTLRNLINMIAARGSLISKATGGRFSATQELVEAISMAADVETIISTVNSTGTLEGIALTEDRITFTGFPEEADPERIQTFMQFASLMNKLALEQKRVSPKPVTETNERYIFRIWLLRMGMAGPEYAMARRALLTPLSGSGAFKDDAMEERWKEKQKAKRG